MIVLMLSAKEVESLAAGKPDRALRNYLLNEMKMERLLPDDLLPARVVLDDLKLVGEREYCAVTRTYRTSEEADAAWEREKES